MPMPESPLVKPKLLDIFGLISTRNTEFAQRMKREPRRDWALIYTGEAELSDWLQALFDAHLAYNAETYYTKESAIEEFAKYATLEHLVENYYDKEGAVELVDGRLEDYYTAADVDSILEDYVTFEDLTTELEDYYTKIEIQTTFEDYPTTIEVDGKFEDYSTTVDGQLAARDLRLGALETFKANHPTSNDHDGRYYTKSEAAQATHSHAESEITGLSTKIAALETFKDGHPTSTVHDSRYYIKGEVYSKVEVDSLIATLRAEITAAATTAKFLPTSEPIGTAPSGYTPVWIS